MSVSGTSKGSCRRSERWCTNCTSNLEIISFTSSKSNCTTRSSITNSTTSSGISVGYSRFRNCTFRSVVCSTITNRNCTSRSNSTYRTFRRITMRGNSCRRCITTNIYIGFSTCERTSYRTAKSNCTSRSVRMVTNCNTCSATSNSYLCTARRTCCATCTTLKC